MFVGHGTLAFALVGFVALALDVDAKRAMALAVTAGLFATVPDVDMVYAITGLLGASLSSPLTLADSFWSASSVVHRSMTHSLLVAIPAAVAFTLIGRSRLETIGALIVGAGIITLAVVVSGPVTGLVAMAFVAGGLVVGTGARRYGLGRQAVGSAALAGLLTHPFGDLLTGQPPDLFYPLPMSLLDGRVALTADPTLNLLIAFGVELGAIWLGAFALAQLRGVRLRSHLKPRATVGAAYATAVLFLPAPTIDGSYHFVFSVVAVGMVGAVPFRRRLPGGLTALTTGLAGMTVAGIAYTIAYLTMHAAPIVAAASQGF
jgi:hypothetical protein